MKSFNMIMMMIIIVISSMIVVRVDAWDFPIESMKSVAEKYDFGKRTRR